MLGATKSSLTIGTIIVELTQIYDHNASTLQMDGQTDRQTNCHDNTALCAASRGKNRRLFFSSHCVIVTLKGEPHAPWTTIRPS